MQPLPVALATGAACAAAGIFSWAAVAPSSQLFGPTICRTGDAAAIALTFDDGPNPAITPKLLELLGRYDVRATFFVIGRSVRAFPALARQIADRGHVIGNHTDTHPRLAFMLPRNIASELDRCDEAIESAARQRAHWTRPPFGYRGPQLNGVIQRRHCEGVVMWSATAWDWTAHNPDRIINRLRRIRGGDIVLLHDGDHRTLEGDRRHTLSALEYWLPRWKDAGVRFKTLDDLYPRGQVAQTHG